MALLAGLLRAINKRRCQHPPLDPRLFSPCLALSLSHSLSLALFFPPLAYSPSFRLSPSSTTPSLSSSPLHFLRLFSTPVSLSFPYPSSSNRSLSLFISRLFFILFLLRSSVCLFHSVHFLRFSSTLALPRTIPLEIFFPSLARLLSRKFTVSLSVQNSDSAQSSAFLRPRFPLPPLPDPRLPPSVFWGPCPSVFVSAPNFALRFPLDRFYACLSGCFRCLGFFFSIALSLCCPPLSAEIPRISLSILAVDSPRNVSIFVP